MKNNMNSQKEPIIILSGPSGVGKGTIERLLFEYEELQLSFSCSATTRKPRNGELNGIHYYFIDTEKFRDKMKNRMFLEFSYHLNNYYGTLYSELDKIHQKNLVPLLEIETNGVKKVLKKFQDEKLKNKYNLITIFLAPPSIDDLRNRILTRGTENNQTLKDRLRKAEIEIADSYIFKYKIINDVPERAAQEIRNILHKELGLD
ncbi:guanylate kinase [Mycoplasmopsis cynos]|uniref:Guanylate kinase n=3 Tax=Mycoplasmopsis cynos TaxID=171284 RepID=L0RUC4_MYCC1|nr:guanylate kinase [Mycoplasmopsis cynos]TQC54625.1 guanylate kinase [Mycoplasmopsis cynos]WQQ15365.1 guanylate kinase [Mycoplasmopsis cynos]WQQ16469.1 guanylate kinase [Mycoplasmopsis cynos]WQQ17115.1 guanylate kinase [Mycoplasmopsis cynos]WQQ17858.1 guanylate kinase [Mycoplasmopsis cynos]